MNVIVNPVTHPDIATTRCGTSFDVVRTRAGMVQLREEWDALWHRSQGSYIQTSACALHSWDLMEAGGAGQLFCGVGRDGDGTLTAVWPLVVRRRAGWRVARQGVQHTAQRRMTGFAHTADRHALAA